MATKKRSKKKVSKKTSAKKSTMKVGDFCRKKILEGGHTSEQIIAKAKKKFPKSKVDKKHLNWYVWDLKRKEIEFPKLPKS